MSKKQSKSPELKILTLFPELFVSYFSTSLAKKSVEKGIISPELIQIRDYAQNKHKNVDDTPYGGGPGMLLKADVLYWAWRAAVPRKQKKTRTILLSPQGPLFTQDKAKELLDYSKLVFVCGHYEGVDQRFIDLCVDEEISIGNYILTGGELAALAVIDTLIRLIPGVVGNQESVQQESLESGLLKYPQYTRPAVFEDMGVPEVLLKGNHREIDRWRQEQMLQITKEKRPDLYHQYLERQQ